MAEIRQNPAPTANHSIEDPTGNTMADNTMADITMTDKTMTDNTTTGSTGTDSTGNDPAKASRENPAGNAAADSQAGHSVKREHRGRILQILIYLGKLLRMFVYQNDWKTLPMAALVAGVVALVIRSSMFVTMEGTIRGAFAIACVCLWNGCFNSIQVICRERDIIKREHRSGMHISSYIFSHMIYQAFLCLLQTGLTINIFLLMQMKFPQEGMFFPYMIMDFSFTIFLITYSSDMMALLISCIARTTTGAMTVMPFILIFQLVFSGGFFELPEWTSFLSNLTISNYGLKCIAAQADYNNLPMVTGWNSLFSMRNEKIEVTMTYEQVLEFLSTSNIESVSEFRELEAAPGITMGQIVDNAATDPMLAEERKQSFTIRTTVWELIETVGWRQVRDIIQGKSAAAAYTESYSKTDENILSYWSSLVIFAIVFGALSILIMEFIDKDKR